MSMGKIIGMGAALAAGLAVAGMTHASVQLEIITEAGSKFLPASPSTNGSYTSSSGSFGGCSWGAITVTSNAATSGQPANLGLGITDLTNTSPSSGDSIQIIASGNEFAYNPSGTNYLQSSGRGDYSSATASDTIT